MIERINKIRAALNAALSRPAAPTAQAMDAAEADAVRAELSTVRAMTIPPLRPLPAGCVALEDGRFCFEEDLDERQRWHREKIEPLQIEMAQKYLELADLAARVHRVMDERENRWGVRETERKKNGKQVSGSAYSLDRSMLLERKVQDRVRYDDLKMKRARAKLEECINEWTEGARDEARQLLEMAFRTNKQGQYSRADIARLKRIKSEDERWKAGIALINEAEIADGSAAYLLMSIRGENGQYHPLPLDLAAVRPYSAPPAVPVADDPLGR